MTKDYYVLDRRDGSLVAIVHAPKEPNLAEWKERQHLYVTEEEPPIQVLRSYEFWDKRP